MSELEESVSVHICIAAIIIKLLLKTIQDDKFDSCDSGRCL